MKKYVQYIPIIGIILIMVKYNDGYWGKYNKNNLRPYLGGVLDFLLSLLIQGLSLSLLIYYSLLILFIR